MVQRLAERFAGYHPLRTASSSTTASSSHTSSCPTSSAAATCTASPPPSTTTTRYVGELAGMAKASNMVIVPDRPNDLSAVLTTALGVYGQVEGAAAKGAAAAVAKSSPPPPPKKGDWTGS